MRAAAEAFLFLYVSLCAPRGRPPQRAVADASLPIGAGLGSSAAYSVALVAAMHGWRAHCAREERAPGAPLDARERAWVNAWAFESERLLHGRPSGVDNAVSAFGGSLAFQEGEVAPLGATPALPLLLVNTRVPRNTKALVAGVRERREALPAAFDHVFGAVHELARSCEALFRSADAADAAACGARLGALVELNHALLRALGVSHAALERVVDVARAHGLPRQAHRRRRRRLRAGVARPGRRRGGGGTAARRPRGRGLRVPAHRAGRRGRAGGGEGEVSFRGRRAPRIPRQPSVHLACTSSIPSSPAKFCRLAGR